jgi:hypothetical protein
MAPVAKPFPALMTLATLAQAHLAPLPVTHKLLADLQQELPVVVPHIGRIPDTVLRLARGPFEKGLGAVRTLREYILCGTVSERDQYEQYWDNHGQEVHLTGL